MGTKLKYGEISSFQFAQTMQKIAATPTDNKSACHIRHVTRELQKAREAISKEYQEDLVEKFAKRDEEGKIIRPTGEPNGFEVLEEKQEEFVAAQEAFGQKEFTINWRALTPYELKDVKLSAQELESLKDLFQESEEGPGLPQNVQSLARK